MPNIQQQKRRVRTAEREHGENTRYRSTAKTLYKRLEEAVAAGDDARIGEEHKALVRWLDKAAARGALHPNKVARKKSQAASLVAAKRA